MCHKTKPNRNWSQMKLQSELTSFFCQKQQQKSKLNGGCSRGVMVKAVDCEIVAKRVRSPVALLRSLSGKYPLERYELLYPPSYWLNSTTAVLLGE